MDDPPSPNGAAQDLVTSRPLITIATTSTTTTARTPEAGRRAERLHRAQSGDGKAALEVRRPLSMGSDAVRTMSGETAGAGLVCEGWHDS